MKVAILGAIGMIGQHTARAAVAGGHSLVVLHRASSDLSALRDLSFEAREVDVSNPSALASRLAGIDGLIDCAAYYPTKPARWQDEVRVAREQLNGVLDAAQAAGVPRIVYVGGAIALARRHDGKPATEADIYSERPNSSVPYLQVKWEMDKIARERGQTGLHVSVAIPSMCFGEYDRTPTTGKLIADIAARKLPAYIRGNRNVIYTGDAGRGIVLVLEKGRSGERYLLTGENHSMDELVPLIARIAGVKAPTRVAPLWLVKALSFVQESRYRMLGGALPTLTSTAVAVVSSGQFLDGSKAQAELGFRGEVPVEEAIARALRWFRQEGYVHAADT